ncbi:tryptophan--tRNA ligase [Candidatus Woesearchaeota archaeon]|jgi:tryptophanyl-tRNA synthetase|nr:tryptophan--tRNA ligase [Candidatus Woesearchaeota archaeon]MBT4387957.1 tryptophan--tRNA ligase [Candidatus Woesearchaeota archaeon]MBT4595301.1 tryptophan--tRNA ligase [Candidatus Woesearchaeota archaeon]MBT5741501.1 tryptophan--tRNA ligase [Candidatus Woesearchaeota archaeon]MBT6505643.1 tryptophan--tRNA ligase [Candidatus Woesearchaeota archaeon]
MVKQIVNPYEVKGSIDYDKLVDEFGVSKINNKLLNEIEKNVGELHFLLRRGYFFSHRDLDKLLKRYSKGEKFVLYTGRGPSGSTTIGHLLSWVFTKWLADKFDVKTYFQITDDEKFLFNPNLNLTETNKLAYEAALDFIALGFKEENLDVIVNTNAADILYPVAIRIAKKLTLSSVKASMGFNDSSNIGINFYTAMQSVPVFLESIRQKKNVPVLIPYGIDQDNHFRLTRDVAEKLGFLKPFTINCKFMPGLKSNDGKMNASDPNSAIYTTDDEKTVINKIKKAQTGGRETITEQKKLGGRPKECNVYSYYDLFFEPDDNKLKTIYSNCVGGSLLCGECKLMLANKVNVFLKKHQIERHKAKSKLKNYFLKKDFDTIRID